MLVKAAQRSESLKPCLALLASVLAMASSATMSLVLWALRATIDLVMPTARPADKGQAVRWQKPKQCQSRGDIAPMCARNDGRGVQPEWS